MAQTDLLTDDWCGYNQSSTPFYWVMTPSPEQGYQNSYSVGEVGINASGGVAGSYVRPDVIDISSFLSGRDDILSKCQPPVPDLDSLREPDLHMQPKDTTILLPKYTREKKSAIDLSAVDYNRWQPNLPADPQDPRFVIEDMWSMRNGLDTQNFIKLAWKPYTGANPDVCRANLDPNRFCQGCEGIAFGSLGKKWLTNQQIPNHVPLEVQQTPSGEQIINQYQRPQGQENYPFTGPYSQDAHAVGAASCGVNFFSGPRLEGGECPVNSTNMLTNSIPLADYPMEPFQTQVRA